MRNRVLITSLIIGLCGATGGAALADSDRDRMSGSDTSDRPSGYTGSSSGDMRSGESGGSSTGQFIDDATVTTRVKSRFAQDDQVSAMNIGVETNGGVVQLSGYAGSEAEKSRAAQIAKEVPNVKSVQNNIIVRGSGSGTGSGSSGSSSGSMSR